LFLRSDSGNGVPELVQQRGQHPDVAGWPVRHEQSEAVQAGLGQPVLLADARGRERYQTRATVGRVGRDLDLPSVFQLPDLPGDQRRVNILHVSD
jgi:hypothetical protein